MVINRYSASELIKRSAAQLVYFRRTGTKPQITENMKIGESYQYKVSDTERKNGHKVADEMCGCYTFGENAIYFCIDIVREDCFVEVKSVFDESGKDSLTYPEWYFESSILQCAVYKSLLMNMDGDTLVTPQFRLNEGCEYKTLKAERSLPYLLKFGSVGVYRVDVTDSKRIIKFLKDKINALKDYDTARAFDTKYKHKEFNLLRDCFTYKKVSQNEL